MLKGIFYILMAALIDGAQILIGLIFTLLGAMAGTVGGAVAGAHIASSITSNATVIEGGAAIGGFFGSFINPGAAAVAAPFGMMVGFGLGVVLSLTLGTALVVLLAFDGMFYPAYVMRAYIGEVIPGLDVIPSWTALVIFSLLRRRSTELLGMQPKQGTA